MSEKFPLSQKLCYFWGSRFSQSFILLTLLHCSLPSKFLVILSNHQKSSVPLNGDGGGLINVCTCCPDCLVFFSCSSNCSLTCCGVLTVDDPLELEPCLESLALFCCCCFSRANFFILRKKSYCTTGLNFYFI